MAESSLTTAALLKVKAITTTDVDFLLSVYEANPSAGPLLLGQGYELDVDAAIAAHPFSAAILEQIPRRLRRVGGWHVDG